MTLNKFCPVAQGEYYNNKSQAQSQLFFPFFSKFFLLCVQYLHFVIINSYKYKMLFLDVTSPNRSPFSCSDCIANCHAAIFKEFVGIRSFL